MRTGATSPKSAKPPISKQAVYGTRNAKKQNTERSLYAQRSIVKEVSDESKESAKNGNGATNVDSDMNSDTSEEYEGPPTGELQVSENCMQSFGTGPQETTQDHQLVKQTEGV